MYILLSRRILTKSFGQTLIIESLVIILSTFFTLMLLFYWKYRHIIYNRTYYLIILRQLRYGMHLEWLYRSLFGRQIFCVLTILGQPFVKSARSRTEFRSAIWIKDPDRRILAISRVQIPRAGERYKYNCVRWRSSYLPRTYENAYANVP